MGDIISRLRASLLGVKPVEDRRLLGISMVLVSLICFTSIDTSAKWLINQGMGIGQGVFLRYGINLVIIVLVFFPLMGKKLFASKRFDLQIIRGLLLLASTVLNFVALSYLSLTLTSAIFFSLPLVLCALSVPFLGEHVGWRRWIAVGIGFLGVLVIVQPGGQGFHWAMLLSLLAVIAVAFYNILNRKLAGVDSVYTQQFYAALVASVFVTPFMFGSISFGSIIIDPMGGREWFWPSLGWSWIAFFAMGFFGLLGHLLLTAAHRFAPASTLAPFVYVQIIWMTLSSWLIFGQVPDIWVWAGGVIVMGSGLYIWNRERNRGHQISNSQH